MGDAKGKWWWWRRGKKRIPHRVGYMRASSLGMVRAAATVAPATAPPSMRDVSTLYTLIRSSNNLCVLTGAGCSTESNIPDYRSPTHGAYSRGHKPMTHQQFMGTEAA